MGDVLCRIGRAHRGLRGDHLTAGGTDQNPTQSEGPKRGGDGRGAAILFRTKARSAPAENSRDLRHCRAVPLAVRSPSRSQGAALSARATHGIVNLIDRRAEGGDSQRFEIRR